MFSRLAAIPNLQICQNAPLSRYTRFGLGGTSSFLIDTQSEEALVTALGEVREARVRHAVIGAGSNLIAHDSGFSGAVLRHTASSLAVDGPLVQVQAGAV